MTGEYGVPSLWLLQRFEIFTIFCQEERSYLPTKIITNVDEVRCLKKLNNFGYCCLIYTVKDLSAQQIAPEITVIDTIEGELVFLKQILIGYNNVVWTNYRPLNYLFCGIVIFSIHKILAKLYYAQCLAQVQEMYLKDAVMNQILAKKSAKCNEL